MAGLYLIPKPPATVALGATFPVHCAKNVIKVQTLPQDVSKIRGIHRLFGS